MGALPGATTSSVEVDGVKPTRECIFEVGNA